MAATNLRHALVWTVVAIMMAGCQGSLVSYQGARLTTSRALPGPDGGKQVSTHETADLASDYSMIRQGSLLSVTGVVHFKSSITTNFSQIRRFYLSLFLADADGNVLTRQGIVATSSDLASDPVTFSTQFTLPPQAALYAFAYDGEALLGDGGNEGGGSTPFWDYPVTKGR
jgi:hypothetical protein